MWFYTQTTSEEREWTLISVDGILRWEYSQFDTRDDGFGWQILQQLRDRYRLPGALHIITYEGMP